jgi:hypothetical protein
LRGVDGKTRSPNPPPKPAARIGTEPSLHLHPARDSLTSASKSKTVDLGLRKSQNAMPDAARSSSSEPGRLRSRVAAAFASVRAALAAESVVATAAPRPRLTGEAAVNPKPPFVSPSANGTSRHTFSTSEPVSARLVSAADGVQFGVVGNRLVLGRATTNGDGVDIDLSQLRGSERISRRHAEIIKEGNDYFVRDLGSINGTYIAGRGRLSRDQLCKLKDRDELVLGGAKLEFRRS